MSVLEISLINLILWFFVGIITGYYLHKYDSRKVSGGVVVTSIFSTMGALFTGYFASFLSGKGMLQFSFEGLLIAGIGAILLAFFYRSSFAK